MNNIIAAISTPSGIGGIAIIRLSGESCINLVDTFFVSPSKKRLSEQPNNSIHFGNIVDENEIIDEVLVSIFRNPHSFTGEDSVEISCHGSLYIQQRLLQLVIDKGACLAKPGEFTQRAFINGKMDLSQAESVADLIASTSATSHRIAMNQMRGGFSNKLASLRINLLDFISLIELELDFSEEDVEFADRTKLTALSAEIRDHIQQLADSFKIGNVIKHGIPVAIIGETNAGKSTLLNKLLKEDKAIVSDIHGTTRDVVEDTLNIKGLSFRLIDTAGIRDTKDSIESIGIERTFLKLREASIVLWVVDITTPEQHIHELASQILPLSRNKKLIIVFNKIDKVDTSTINIKKEFLYNEIQERLFISAEDAIGINQLEDKLVEVSNIPEIGEQDVIVSNMRHYESLCRALESIERVIKGLSDGIATDFIAQDIRECMYYLGEITGDIATDEVLGNIFGKFCIGK